MKKLRQKTSALVIVDFQEAFRKAIPDFDELAKSIKRAATGFGILDCPVIVTEQYPKGLGHTALEVLEVLPAGFQLFEKSAFSSCGDAAFVDSLKTNNISQVLLCGVETHICVNQTALDLLESGYQVHVLEDCVGSRFQTNKEIGLAKLYRSGAIPCCVEMALFEIMGDSKSPQFKEIQELIK